jgi:hypothetical protein
VQPGQTVTLRYPFIMHSGMGGPHRIQITLRTDSPETPTVTLLLTAQAG